MDNLCKKNIASYPVITDMIFDFSRATNKFSSNLSINFDIFSKLPLPNNTKLEIIESKFEYCIDKIDKKILLDGNMIDTNNTSINDIICLQRKHINLVDNSCDTLLLNVTENIKIDISVKINIRGIAHTSNCKEMYFEACGIGKDKIESIITSNIFVPNFSTCNIDTHIKVRNNLIGLSNSEYIFLSPIYDCNGNIQFLLGNVFVNYCLNLNLASLIASNISLLAYDNKKLS